MQHLTHSQTQPQNIISLTLMSSVVQTVLEPTAHGTSSSWATVLIWGLSIPVWFTGDLSAPGGTDACLSEPAQGDGWKNRPLSALPLFSVDLQWKMLNTSDPLSINDLVRRQGAWGTSPQMRNLKVCVLL